MNWSNVEDDEMVCSSCDQPKNKLFAKKSKLVGGATLFMCQTCLDNGYEPRWAIILAGRTAGVASIRQYIIQGLYVGEKISASEIVT